VSDKLKPCDWLTRFVRVIPLGLSSVKPFLQYRLRYSRVCVGFVQKCTHFTIILDNQGFLSVEPVNYFVKVFTNEETLSSKLLAHCGDSIEGKHVTAVDELKGGLECGNATEESEKDAGVENT
jgi:hypothetical protein